MKPKKYKVIPKMRPKKNKVRPKMIPKKYKVRPKMKYKKNKVKLNWDSFSYETQKIQKVQFWDLNTPQKVQKKHIWDLNKTQNQEYHKPYVYNGFNSFNTKWVHLRLKNIFVWDSKNTKSTKNIRFET